MSAFAYPIPIKYFSKKSEKSFGNSKISAIFAVLKTNNKFNN